MKEEKDTKEIYDNLGKIINSPNVCGFEIEVRARMYSEPVGFTRSEEYVPIEEIFQREDYHIGGDFYLISVIDDVVYAERRENHKLFALRASWDGLSETLCTDYYGEDTLHIYVRFK